MLLWERRLVVAPEKERGRRGRHIANVGCGNCWGKGDSKVVGWVNAVEIRDVGGMRLRVNCATSSTG